MKLLSIVFTDIVNFDGGYTFRSRVRFMINFYGETVKLIRDKIILAIFVDYSKKICIKITQIVRHIGKFISLASTTRPPTK